MIKFRVPVVVDGGPNRGLVRRGLGYRVREAADGEVALAEVAREIQDLILPDLKMPRQTSYVSNDVILSSGMSTSFLERSACPEEFIDARNEIAQSQRLHQNAGPVADALLPEGRLGD
jgi:hypothetical protein